MQSRHSTLRPLPLWIMTCDDKQGNKTDFGAAYLWLLAKAVLSVGGKNVYLLPPSLQLLLGRRLSLNKSKGTL